MDLDEKEWKSILRTNSLLSGLVLNSEKEIKRARRPAFTLRDDASDEPGCPDFEINDDSSISVVELHSDFEIAATDNSLGLRDIAAVIKTNLFVVSGAASGSYKVEKSLGNTVSSHLSRDDIYAAYNFPRVIVYLQPEHVQPSEYCLTAIKDVEKSGDINSLGKFFETFGHIYSSVVHLGGRLQCTRSARSVSGTTSQEKRESMKMAAGAYVSASKRNKAGADFHRETLDHRMNSLSLENEAAIMAWEARGGDTLLSSDPALWAPSVASYKNWRVIKREEVETITTFLGRCSDTAHVPELFMWIISSFILLSESGLQPHNIDLRDIEDRKKSLLWAIERNDEKLVKFILRKETKLRDLQSDSSALAEPISALAKPYKTDVAVKDQILESQNPLVRWSTTNGRAQILSLLLDYMSVNQQDENGYTALHGAAKVGNETAVRALLIHGVDINGLNPVTYYHRQISLCGALPGDVNPPIFIAIQASQRSTVELFINLGADLESMNLVNRTPLAMATAEQQCEIVETLLKHGASPDVTIIADDTCLHYAVDHDDVKMIEILVKGGANINSRTEIGKATPLHIAARYGKSDAAAKLIELGADLNLVDSMEMTPLHMATKFSCASVVRLLLAAGANSNIPMPHRRSNTKNSSGRKVRKPRV